MKKDAPFRGASFSLWREGSIRPPQYGPALFDDHGAVGLLVVLVNIGCVALAFVGQLFGVHAAFYEEVVNALGAVLGNALVTCSRTRLLVGVALDLVDPVFRTALDQVGHQFEAASETFSTRSLLISLMWTRPSTPGKDASNHAYVYDLDGKQLQEIELPSLGSVGFSGNKDDKECFFGFTSFTIPGATYKYDMDKNSYELYRAPKVQFNSDDFVTEQVFFPSKDGVKIPMFLTYKKDLKKDGKNPVFLYGYGGFGISLNPGFSSSRIPFLENGGIYAQVNLRGGSEYGEEWHVAGTKMQKQNVFDDFISAAEYLISQKYTDKDKIAIVGGSNGGLLVGACMTQRPDLFRVAIPQVGVMDMLRYHKFTIGWNWASDYGTSEDSKEMFEYLRGYSPLHNLKPGTKYPATLVTTADHDDRVVPAHSFKFAATLQADNDGTNPTLIRIDNKAGHGAGKPMAKVLEEQADIYGFIMYNLGMKPKF